MCCWTRLVGGCLPEVGRTTPAVGQRYAGRMGLGVRRRSAPGGCQRRGRVGTGRAAALLAGEPTAVDSFLETIDAPRRLDLAALRGTADGLAALAAAHGVATTGARYVELSADSAAKLAQYGRQLDGAGGFYGFVRNASGQFVGNLTMKPAALVGSRALSLQVTMAMAAMRLALQETHRCRAHCR